MERKRARRILGIMILLISLLILIWGLWPFAAQIRSLPVSPTEMQLPTPGSLLPVLASDAFVVCFSGRWHV